MERFETEKTKMAALQDANETMKSKIDRYTVCQLVRQFKVVWRTKIKMTALKDSNETLKSKLYTYTVG